MKLTLLKTLSLTVLLACAAPAFAAANDDNWTNLAELRRGDKVGIILRDQKRVEGRFGSFNDSSITVTGDHAATLEKDKVVRVYTQKGWSRTKRTLIGLAIGAGAGVAADVAIGVRLNNEGSNLAPGAFTALGAGLGAGFGAATGSGYKTIYRRAKL